MSLFNLLKPMVAGMAATSPRAVAKRASAIPGATTASEVLAVAAIEAKEFIIPQTVPKRPMKGAADPTDARKIMCVSSRSEEHTSELQSRENLVCRLLLEKKDS